MSDLAATLLDEGSTGCASPELVPPELLGLVGVTPSGLLATGGLLSVWVGGGVGGGGGACLRSGLGEGRDWLL